jgi:hypothetical protein
MELFQTCAIVVLLVAVPVTLLLNFVIARQVGLILVRVGPAVPKDLDAAPIGLPVDDFSLRDIFGNGVTVAAHARALVLFVSPRCDACTSLIPGLKTFASSPPQPTQIVAVTCRDLTPDDYEYAAQLSGLGIRYVADPAVCAQLAMESPPYAVLIEHGAIRSKGIVNSLQHLEGLYLVSGLSDSRDKHPRQRHTREDAAELALTEESALHG